MSMDPDGTNRIIKQQIKQWYSEVDQQRNAALVEREPARSPRWLISPVGRAVAAVLGRLASYGHRPAVGGVALPRRGD